MTEFCEKTGGRDFVERVVVEAGLHEKQSYMVSFELYNVVMLNEAGEFLGSRILKEGEVLVYTGYDKSKMQHYFSQDGNKLQIQWYQLSILKEIL